MMTLTPVEYSCMNDFAQDVPRNFVTDEEDTQPTSHHQVHTYLSAGPRSYDLGLCPTMFVQTVNQLARKGLLDQFKISGNAAVGFTPKGFNAWHAHRNKLALVKEPA